MQASNSHLTVTLYSNHFAVTNCSPRGRELCLEFAKRFVQWGWVTQRGHTMRVMERIYGATTKARDEFRFHINALPQFKIFLEERSATGPLVVWQEMGMYEAAAAKMNLRAHFSSRDYQLPIIEYLDDPEPVSKLVTLQTGKGKGYVTMKAAEHQGQRVVVIVRPMFMQKWRDEILEMYEDVSAEDILMVQGGKQLMTLLQMGVAGQIDAKWIIISNKTLQIWLKEYEEHGAYSLELGYACRPYEMFQALGAGIRVIDEIHLDWHLNFKIDLYTHCPKSIALSATMLSEQPFIASTYELAYPMSKRSQSIALDRYLDAMVVYYRFEKPEKIRTQELGRTNYSHTAFEKSVMKNMKVLHNYYGLIEHVMEVGFFQHPREKKSLLIFCASVEMCTSLVEHLKDKYPGRDVRRYVGTMNDPFDDLIDGEIVVSTIGSAGTAIDKPNLTNVILTIAVSSVKSNVQTFGRLRRLESDGLPGDAPENQTQFHYFACSDIPKHLEYDQAKQQVLLERARTCVPYFSGRVL